MSWRGCTPASGAVTRRTGGSWRTTPPPQGPSRRSTSTRRTGCRPRPTACSATSRSRPTPAPTTSGACGLTCSRSSARTASTRSTPTSAWPSRPARSARQASCAMPSTPAPISATHAAAAPVPLGPASIRKLLDTLAAILGDAVEDGHIDRNPAQGRRLRVRVPKPPRTFLELDELQALIDAAARRRRARTAQGSRAARPRTWPGCWTRQEPDGDRRRARARQGHRQLSRPPPRRLRPPYVGRAFVVRVLGCRGVRNTELCDLRIRNARLHEQGGARVPHAGCENGDGHPGRRR